MSALADCPACDGTGAHSVPAENIYGPVDREVYDCGFCNGTGKVPEDRVEEILDEIE